MSPEELQALLGKAPPPALPSVADDASNPLLSRLNPRDRRPEAALGGALAAMPQALSLPQQGLEQWATGGQGYFDWLQQHGMGRVPAAFADSALRVFGDPLMGAAAGPAMLDTAGAALKGAPAFAGGQDAAMALSAAGRQELLQSRLLQAVGRSNANKADLLLRGAMPADAAAATKARTAEGPIRTYHGTATSFDRYDLSKMDENALFGPGVYTTENPEIAAEYAAARAEPINSERRAGERTIANLQDDTRLRQGFLTRLQAMTPEEFDPAGWSEATREAAIANQRYIIGRNTKDIAYHTQRLEQLPGAGEHIRPQFLDARNPLNADTFQLSPEDLRRLDWDFAPQNLSHQMADVAHKLGYDAIVHQGGKRVGNVEHPVWIALDPKQVYQPYVVPPMQPAPAPASRNALLDALGGAP